MDTITPALKRAIRASGMSMLALQRATGVNRQCIARLMRGDGSMQLDNAGMLAGCLGLALQPIRKAKEVQS